jgi:hypothetical protein
MFGLKIISVENAIIIDVEATTAIRQAGVLAAKRMIERSLERFDLYPNRLLGDSGYGSAEMLGWLLYEHGIEPHVTVFDKSTSTDGTFSREDFIYDHAEDVYHCPGGKALTTTAACEEHPGMGPKPRAASGWAIISGAFSANAPVAA